MAEIWQSDPDGVFKNWSDTPRNPLLHATAVCFDGRGVLILGPSGSGKTTLAWQLMSLGAELIADDRVYLRAAGDQVWLAQPDHIADQIEAPGWGVFKSPSIQQAPIALICDLSKTETQRMPKRRSQNLFGQDFPMVHKIDNPAFPAMIKHYVIHGSDEQNAV